MDDNNKSIIENAIKQYSIELQNAISDFLKPNNKLLNETIVILEENSLQLAKSFGVGRDRALDMKKSLADGLESVIEMGGNMTQVNQIAQSVSTSLSRNLILTKDAYSELFATAKVTGLENETLMSSFKDAGYSIYQISENMEKVVNTAVASGVNAKTVSREVVSNMSLMDKYNFDGGVEGLSKMVTQATNLRISVKSIEAAMSKAFEPESAIEMAAALQRLGVSQSELLDPLRLMDLAQNDPAEFQNQIVEMSKTFVEFDEKTKSFQIAPGAKRQLQEVATAIGIPAGELAKMARASAELDDKLSKISFPDTFDEDQKKLIANMAEMGDGGEYIMRVDGQDLNIDQAMKLFEEQPEVYKKFMDEAKPKSMEEIAKSQLTSIESMDATLKRIALGGMAPAIATSSPVETMQTFGIELSQTLNDVLGGDALSVKGLREGIIESNVDAVSKGFESGDVIGTLTNVENNITGYLENVFNDFGEGFKKGVERLEQSSNPFINVITNFVKDYENLDTNVVKTTENFDKLNEKIKTVTTNTTPTTEVKNILENTKTTTITPSTSTNEINFTTPLEIKISLSGLQAGMSEADLIRLFNEGKLNQIIEKAVAEAMKEKIGK